LDEFVLPLWWRLLLRDLGTRRFSTSALLHGAGDRWRQNGQETTEWEPRISNPGLS